MFLRLVVSVVFIALGSSAACSGQTAGQRHAALFLSSLRKLQKQVSGDWHVACMWNDVMVGRGMLRIGIGSRDDQDCYRISKKLTFGKPGPGALVETVEAYFTADLHCLHSEERRGTQEIEEWSRVTTRQSDFDWEEEVSDAEGGTQTLTFECPDGLLPNACEELVMLLLPRKKGRVYEFVQNQFEGPDTPRTLAVEGIRRVDGTKLWCIQLTDIEPADEGVDSSGGGRRLETLYGLDRNGLARMEYERHGRRVTLLLSRAPTELPEVDLEVVGKLERPVDPVLAYWHARAAGDERLLRNAIDAGRMIEILMAQDDEYMDMSDSAKELAAALLKEKILSQIVQDEPDSSLLPFIALMTSEWLDVTTESETAATVEVKDALPADPAEEILDFRVEQHSSGRWKLVELVSKTE